MIAAAREAIERHGAGAGRRGSSPAAIPLYAELESLLAEMKGAERALVFSSGYLANVGMIPALVGKDDLILADRLCHACMWDGARLSGRPSLRFSHNDLEHCRELLEAHRGSFGRCLILTETVFSMDGDLGPVDGAGRAGPRPRRLADDRRRPRAGHLSRRSPRTSRWGRSPRRWAVPADMSAARPS